VNRNLWRVLVAIIALLMLWARGKYEEWQSSAVVCQLGFLPGQSDAAYAPALVEAGLDADCGPLAGAGGPFQGTSVTSSATNFLRGLTAN
jgi:hypothetical protein